MRGCARKGVGEDGGLRGIRSSVKGLGVGVGVRRASDMGGGIGRTDEVGGAMLGSDGSGSGCQTGPVGQGGKWGVILLRARASPDPSHQPPSFPPPTPTNSSPPTPRPPQSRLELASTVADEDRRHVRALPSSDRMSEGGSPAFFRRLSARADLHAARQAEALLASQVREAKR
jgi:hypothetical protein